MISPPDNPQRWCDFDRLARLVSDQFDRDSHYSPHGPDHWRRVERNGLWLSTHTGADIMVVRIFAWLHDSQRLNDGHDPDHGPRAAEYAQTLFGDFFEMDEPAFEALLYACNGHTHEQSSPDSTIGTCWDADRLDLGRVGVIPSEEYMSTGFGRAVARAGSFAPFREELRKAGMREVP
ncbi:MAG: hypothetical protein ACAI35_26785 [Candidatus Methylacidiphilales bacterium]|nr:hypothetical protein [Candidatus Methylacidiphilales bacterium]